MKLHGRPRIIALSHIVGMWKFASMRRHGLTDKLPEKRRNFQSKYERDRDASEY